MKAEVCFATAADRAAFAEDLATAVTTLVTSYHDETADSGRYDRVIITAGREIGRLAGAEARPPRQLPDLRAHNLNRPPASSLLLELEGRRPAVSLNR